MPTFAPPPVTRDQVRRFELLTLRCGESLMRATDEAVPDNGQGYAFFPPRDLPTGQVRATLSTNPHARWATAAIGLTRADEATIDDVLAFFAAHGVPPVLRIVPDGFTPAQADRLSRRGLRQVGFHAIMWSPLPLPPGGAEPLDGLPADVEICRVTDADEYDVALETQIAGWGIPYNPDSPMKRMRRCWRTAPGHHMYLARVGGAPAAHAMMWTDGGVAYLENASTIDCFRGRGLHSALIRRRIADAASEFGCGTVVGAADFESSSRTNQMRAGLQLAYLAAFWATASPPAERQD